MFINYVSKLKIKIFVDIKLNLSMYVHNDN
jgi:hypothetical protein